MQNKPWLWDNDMCYIGNACVGKRAGQRDTFEAFCYLNNKHYSMLHFMSEATDRVERNTMDFFRDVTYERAKLNWYRNGMSCRVGVTDLISITKEGSKLLLTFRLTNHSEFVPGLIEAKTRGLELLKEFSFNHLDMKGAA